MRAPKPVVALPLAVASFWPLFCAAQIAPDATLGTAVTNAGGAYTISGGSVKGNNLFHSFSQFSVPTSGKALFEGPTTVDPTTIQNVLSRVTGVQASSIDGTISTRDAALARPMFSANFWLINPNGVIFGPNAILDVGGAVRISTADQIIFSDYVFSAKPDATADALLSAKAPQAFGFLSSNPASITLDGAQLVADPGQTLSLVGGDITLKNG